MVKLRILHWLIALDQMAYCTLTLGRGSPMETCSAAAYRIELDGGWFWFWRPIIDALFWFDPEHCKKSFENLQRLKYLPDAYKLQP